MRIDLPRCGFKPCRHQFDGNCTYPDEYKRCQYIRAVETIEAIMGTQKFCTLCQNNSCKDGITSEATCIPVWNGLGI